MRFETTKEQNERVRLERAEDRESLRVHKPKVIGVRFDGKELFIEYTTAEGERVSAGYVQSSWGKPPAAVLKKAREDMQRPPIHMVGRRR
jgi:hypothetical protein